MSSKLTLTSRRDDCTCKGCRRRDFDLEFEIPGSDSLEAIALRAKIALDEHQRGCSELVESGPEGEWLVRLREKQRTNKIVFKGHICENGVPNGKFSDKDAVVVASLENIAKVVGTEIWDHLYRYKDGPAEARLTYGEKFYCVYLFAEETTAKEPVSA